MYELGAFLWNQEQANEMGFTRCKKGVAAIQNICTNIKKESQKALNLKHIFVKKVFTPDMEQIMFEFRHMYLITSRRDGAPSVLMPE